MTLLRVGFMLDEDLLGRKSGVGICFEAYLSNINPLLFFFFLRCLCYLLFLLSFVEQQHLQDYNSTMARSFAQRRDSTYKYRVLEYEYEQTINPMCCLDTSSARGFRDIIKQNCRSLPSLFDTPRDEIASWQTGKQTHR